MLSDFALRCVLFIGFTIGLFLCIGGSIPLAVTIGCGLSFLMSFADDPKENEPCPPPSAQVGSEVARPTGETMTYEDLARRESPQRNRPVRPLP